MVTKSNKIQQKKLSIEQLNAIDLLVLGKTDKEVAEAVKVHRCTVTSWRLYNPYFQAELNRRRKEIWGAIVDKFRALQKKALDVVEQAIELGDVKVALEILKMGGLDLSQIKTNLGNYMVGEDAPDRIVEKLAEEKQLKQYYSGLVSFFAYEQDKEASKKQILNELKQIEKLKQKEGE